MRYVTLNIVQARDLKSVSWFSKNQPYVVVWVNPREKRSTRVAKDGGANPYWNEQVQVPVEEADLTRSDVVLTLEIYNYGSNKLIGTSHISLSSIPSNQSGATTLTYQVIRPNGRPRGNLSVIAKLAPPTEGDGEKTQYLESADNKPNHNVDQPVTAYPVYGAVSSHDPLQNNPYPPPSSYGHYPYQQQQPPQGYPPQFSQGYPQSNYYPPKYPQGGYGGYPPQRPPKKPSRFGGAGLGLGAGLLGGLLIGDAIGDADYGGGDYGDGGGDFGGGDFGGGDFSGGDF